MTPDEIVKALREMLPPKADYAELVCAEGFAHGQCYVWDDPEPYIISAAADLIESLQTQLAESQRREQAAVEDLKRFSACCQCNANIDGSCCDMFDGTAENKYFCSNWQWRGPQEAGKGETGK